MTDSLVSVRASQASMKFVRSLFALIALATVSACSAASPPPAIEDVEPARAVAMPNEDLSGLPRSYAVYFETNSAEIRASTMQVLWLAAQNASKLKPLTIRVQGFTDGSGHRSYNQRLSERRAAAVVAQLAKLGVTVGMDSRGLGESRGKQKDAHNRRVEITFEGSAASAALPVAPTTLRAGPKASALGTTSISPSVAATATILAAQAQQAALVLVHAIEADGRAAQRPAHRPSLIKPKANNFSGFVGHIW